MDKSLFPMSRKNSIADQKQATHERWHRVVLAVGASVALALLECAWIVLFLVASVVTQIRQSQTKGTRGTKRNGYIHKHASHDDDNDDQKQE